MRKVLLTLGILALVCTPAMAGRNANGALLVHTNDAYNFSSLTVCTAPEGDPGVCANVNTRSTRMTGATLWLLAAFEETASPGVTVIYFGINYDTQNLDPGVATKLCGPAGSLEVPDDGWPYTGFGNSIAFGSPVYDTLFSFYAFKVDNYGDGVGEFFCTDINPTGGYAAFVDDSNPPLLDEIHNFGCVRWGEPGYANCPVPPAQEGACCFPDGTCIITPPTQCGGVYMGDGTVCDPNPCEVPAACCFEDGTCALLLRDACAQAGGSYFGGPCDPNPCPPPAGACCFADGSCQLLDPDACTAAGGTFNGAASCDPNPCPPPETGACCFDDGSCTVTTEVDCGGSWQGPGTNCDPNLCQPVATESTTWGQIKANYR